LAQVRGREPLIYCHLSLSPPLLERNGKEVTKLVNRPLPARWVLGQRICTKMWKTWKMSTPLT